MGSSRLGEPWGNAKQRTGRVKGSPQEKRSQTQKIAGFCGEGWKRVKRGERRPKGRQMGL